MASPLWTVTVALRLPHFAALSQSRQHAHAPICAKIFSQEAGMNGVSRMVQMRMVSRRLYITLARRARLASSLASTHGAVSSIYLFAR